MEEFLLETPSYRANYLSRYIRDVLGGIPSGLSEKEYKQLLNNFGREVSTEDEFQEMIRFIITENLPPDTPIDSIVVQLEKTMDEKDTRVSKIKKFAAQQILGSLEDYEGKVFSPSPERFSDIKEKYLKKQKRERRETVTETPVTESSESEPEVEEQKTEQPQFELITDIIDQLRDITIGRDFDRIDLQAVRDFVNESLLENVDPEEIKRQTIIRFGPSNIGDIEVEPVEAVVEESEPEIIETVPTQLIEEEDIVNVPTQTTQTQNPEDLLRDFYVKELVTPFTTIGRNRNEYVFRGVRFKRTENLKRIVTESMTELKQLQTGVMTSEKIEAALMNLISRFSNEAKNQGINPGRMVLSLLNFRDSVVIKEPETQAVILESPTTGINDEVAREVGLIRTAEELEDIEERQEQDLLRAAGLPSRDPEPTQVIEVSDGPTQGLATGYGTPAHEATLEAVIDAAENELLDAAIDVGADLGLGDDPVVVEEPEEQVDVDIQAGNLAVDGSQPSELTSIGIEEEQPVNQLSEPVQPERPTGVSAILTPRTYLFHETSLIFFFGTNVNPDWNKELELSYRQQIENNKIPEKQRSQMMDLIINESGGLMLVSQKETESDVEELLVLLELHFKVNKLSQGPIAGIPLKQLLQLREQIAPQQTTQTQEQQLFPEAADLQPNLVTEGNVEVPSNIVQQEAQEGPIPVPYSVEAENKLSEMWLNRPNNDNGAYLGDDNPFLEDMRLKALSDSLKPDGTTAVTNAIIPSYYIPVKKNLPIKKRPCRQKRYY